MPHYKVSLYRNLLSSDGHPFHCLQTVVEVEAEAPEAAVPLVLGGLRGGARDWDIEVKEHPLDPSQLAVTRSPQPSGSASSPAHGAPSHEMQAPPSGREASENASPVIRP